MSDFFASKLGVRGGGKPEQENPLSWSELLAGDAPRTAEGWSVPEAFLAVLLAAVTCDGELAAAEREELVALAHRSRALKSLSPAQLGELNALVAARMNESDAALGDACAALPEDMRLSVFAHALDLVLADGELNVDEADFLNGLILNLKLDRDGVSRVADVISLKNRF